MQRESDVFLLKIEDYINGENIYNYLKNLPSNHKILNNSVGVTLRTIKENGPLSSKYANMSSNEAYTKWLNDNSQIIQDLNVIECWADDHPEIANAFICDFINCVIDFSNKLIKDLNNILNKE